MTKFALPLLLVTPHNSGNVLPDVLRDMLGEWADDLTARQKRLDHLFDQSDPYTDKIFALPGARHLQAEVSRFVVDLNRARDCPGSSGVLKYTDFDLNALYPATYARSAARAEARLTRYWDPFHRNLAGFLAGGAVELLISGHAITPLGPPLGPDAGQPRPGLCLMTGGDTSGETLGGAPSVSPEAARALQASAKSHFAAAFAAAPEVPAEVALNDPWRVDEISFRYSRPERPVPVPGFGLEVNRALYLTRRGVCETKVQALQQALAAFSHDALAIVRAYPLGIQG